MDGEIPNVYGKHVRLEFRIIHSAIDDLRLSKNTYLASDQGLFDLQFIASLISSFEPAMLDEESKKVVISFSRKLKKIAIRRNNLLK